MAKIICTLPHASLSINGIEFEPHEEGVISKDIADQEVVDNFISIKGYRLAEPAKKPQTGDAAAAAAKAEAEAEFVALQARATALGINVDARWKAARLRTEIKAVDDEAAAAAEKKAAEGDSSTEQANGSGDASQTPQS